MRRYGLLFWLIFIVAIVLGVLLGRIDSLRKELTRARQSSCNRPTADANSRRPDSSTFQKFRCFQKTGSRENYQLLSYKLKSGDTYMVFFGHAWKKIVKTENAEYVKLPAGKKYQFPGIYAPR